jgi:uncharacterized protein YdhG (YjbR/CyaY superfamily)
MKKDHPQKPAKNVDEYLAAVPNEVRPVLEKLRKAIRSAAPKAEEGISFQIPMFRYHRPLVFFAAFRNHCNLYVVSKLIVEAFSSELKPWGHIRHNHPFSRQNIHFPHRS